MPEKGWTSITVRTETKELLATYAREVRAQVQGQAEEIPGRFRDRLPYDEAITRLLKEGEKRE